MEGHEYSFLFTTCEKKNRLCCACVGDERITAAWKHKVVFARPDGSLPSYPLLFLTRSQVRDTAVQCSSMIAFPLLVWALPKTPFPGLTAQNTSYFFFVQVFGETDPKSPGLPVKLSSAAIAGFTAAAFSLPFDMLKSRLQASVSDGFLSYDGIFVARGIPAVRHDL